ncbi:MAG: hypothetical protein GY816_08410 [Cytophagales bacterium]|nr:hypothetical protein [Cytophagales bacterium]
MRPPTYEMFNYNIRPAKAIERRIFLDVLKEIYGVSPSKNLSYIGLGSIYFTDFRLIHKELNINQMINIESNIQDEKRFKFNKPFKCIQLKWGNSTDVLPTLDWRGRKIVWMDYDEILQPFMFDDLDSIFSNIEEGSFYFFTCNNSLGKYINKETKVHDPDRFGNDFNGYAPLGLNPDDLTSLNTPKLVRKMLLDRINRILSDRNALEEPEDYLEFNQLLNIKYKDGANMYSYGGYVSKRKDAKIFKQNGLSKLPFISYDEDILDLKSPIITNQEIDLMNSFLPHGENTFLNLKKLSFIPLEEKSKYFKTYRYYPYYAEIRN